MKWRSVELSKRIKIQRYKVELEDDLKRTDLLRLNCMNANGRISFWWTIRRGDWVTEGSGNGGEIDWLIEEVWGEIKVWSGGCNGGEEVLGDWKWVVFNECREVLSEG